MNWLWEDYDENAQYAVAESNLNIDEVMGVSDGKRKVNPLLRFSEIFAPIIADESMEERQEIENKIFHILAKMDSLCGIHRSTLIEYDIERDIQAGCFGTLTKNRFAALTKEEQRKLLSLIRRQDEEEGHALFFCAAMEELFPHSRVYFYENEGRFLLYVPQKETDERKERLQLVFDLFLDFTANLPMVFWNKHFGIIGDPQTMQLDNIVLY